MLPYQRAILSFSFSIRTIPQRMSGMSRGITSGLQEGTRALPLAECIMPTLLLESTSTFAFFLPLSQGPPPLNICTLLRALFIQPSKMPALHVVFWRMIQKGINVLGRQDSWQQVISFATSLSPSYVTALLQIQGDYGRSLLITFVMTLLANLLGCTLGKTPLLKRSEIMASIS